MTLDGVLHDLLSHLDQHRDAPGYQELLVRLQREVEARVAEWEEKEEVCESK